MATQVQNRRGSTTQHTSFTGANGELTVDTDKKTVVVHDGTTAGGAPLLRQDMSNVPAGTVTSTMIADGAIVNADINASAAIAGTKISPDFGSQNLISTGTSTAASFIPTSSTVPTNGVYLPAANSVAISTGGTGRLFVDATGKVGIGTTAPLATLSLSKGGAESIHIFPGDASNLNRTTHFNNSGGAWVSNVLNAGEHRFEVTGTERMRLDSSGRLGIGTSSPAGRLHVTGGDSLFGAGNLTRILNASQIIDFTDSTQSVYVAGRINGLSLKFYTNAGSGVDIDSSGRVGIGTSSPGYRLDVSGAINASGGMNVNTSTGTASSIVFNQYAIGVAEVGLPASENALTFKVWNNTALVERSRIDSSGRLLVGTSTFAGTNAYSTSQRLSIAGSAFNGVQLQGYSNDSYAIGIDFSKSRSASVGTNTVVQSGDALGNTIYNGFDGTGYIQAAQITGLVDGTPGTNSMPGRLVFSTTASGSATPTERMRIDSSGRLLVGTSTALSGSTALIQAASSGNAAFLQGNNALYDILGLYSTPTSGNNVFANFGTEASFTSRGTIDYNRSAGQVRYNVTSDRRLKSDIQDSKSALTTLNQIKVRSYTWAETGYGVKYGFIAQELNEAAPDAVKVGDDGDEVVDIWAVDNAKLVPLLTKALQEALQRIETLEAKVPTLEGA